MFESFSESLALTAQQKEGIGELIALWIFAISILIAIVILIRHRKKKQLANDHFKHQQRKPPVQIRKKTIF